MGIIVHDSVMTKFGIGIPDLQASDSGTFSVSKKTNGVEPATYLLTGNITYRVNAESEAVHHEQIQVEITLEELDSGLVPLNSRIYTALKAKYLSTEDN